MKKEELVKETALKAEVNEKEATKVVNAFLKVIEEQLAKKEEVCITGFGTFSVKHVNERQGISPKDKKPITIKAQDRPHFKAGKVLKRAVNPIE